MIKALLLIIFTSIILSGCDRILEPVQFSKELTNHKPGFQEEFNIEINILTFDKALKANQDPYTRQVMYNGTGTNANVFNESHFLNYDIPQSLKYNKYTLGEGDKIYFIQENEYAPEFQKLPTKSNKTEYLIGVGDQLTFIQLNNDIDNLIIQEKNMNSNNLKKVNEIIKTSGIVGSDGNILLLGLGSIRAINKTLNQVQNEVRNILIRNGVSPNFQIEITGFNSKKAFIAFPNENNTFGNNIIPITNLPITLKELGVTYGLKPSSDNETVISLKRNKRTFRITAGQLFNLKYSDIIIQDKDQIEINDNKKSVFEIESFVDFKGNILLPNVGKFKAIDRTLEELYSDIQLKLIEKGFQPNFQLELTEFKSKKAYFITKTGKNKIIRLTNKKISLKDILIEHTENSLNKTDLSLIILTRAGKVYKILSEKIFAPNAKEIWIKHNDQIETKGINYKPNKIFVLSGAGNAKIIEVSPSKRETLADILFTDAGPFKNNNVRLSEVYLLRGRNPSIAYHLNTQNVSRILVANKTELRPNDIVFVADRSIISFTRALRELNPLRILLRDIENGNIP